jgi:hypothetical protein
MEQSPTSEANWFAASQEIPHIIKLNKTLLIKINSDSGNLLL